jgi:hypothetical protein
MSDDMSTYERLRRIGDVLLRGVDLHLDAYETPVAVEGRHRHIAVGGSELQKCSASVALTEPMSAAALC